MNSSACSRNNILNRLQQTTGVLQKDSGYFTFHEGRSFDEGKRWPSEEKVLRLKRMMEAVHTEVHLCGENTWKKTLCSVLEQKQIQKSSTSCQKNMKIEPGGTLGDRGCQKSEFAAKMAQDASKRGFKEALEASWGRLGRPKREPKGTKIEAGRVFF